MGRQSKLASNSERQSPKCSQSRIQAWTPRLSSRDGGRNYAATILPHHDGYGTLPEKPIQPRLQVPTKRLHTVTAGTVRISPLRIPQGSMLLCLGMPSYEPVILCNVLLPRLRSIRDDTVAHANLRPSNISLKFHMRVTRIIGSHHRLLIVVNLMRRCPKTYAEPSSRYRLSFAGLRVRHRIMLRETGLLSTD